MTKNITQLPPAAALAGTEVLPVIQSGVDVKATVASILDLAANATQVELDAAVASLTSLITAKAADSAVVKLTGAQTVAGVKTFSDNPVVPDGSWSIADTTGLQAALDAKATDASTVKLTTDQTVAGIKTFSSSPVVPDGSWSIADTTGLQTALPDVVLAAAGGTDDTAMVNTGKTAAGVGGTLVFASGIYVVTGLTASLANQRWQIRPGATVKLKNASNAPVIAVTASGVTIDGGGTIDGNRSNQTSTAAIDFVQGNTAGVRAITVDKLTVRGLTIKDTGVGGVFADNVTKLAIVDNEFEGCGQTGNYKVITVYFTVGSSTGVRITGNRIDGATRGLGCIGISLNAASRVISRLRISNNECLVGTAGATATLGIELFSAGGGLFKDAVVADNLVIGTAGATVYGISISGTTSDATLGGAAISVTGNVVRTCQLCSIELNGSGIACTGNVAFASGFAAISAASPQTGGIRAVTFSGNSLFDTVGAGYAVHVAGNTDGINGAVVANNTIHNPAGSSIVCDGVISNLVVSGNVVTLGKGPGFSATGATTDSIIAGNDFDLTGAGANQDAIVIAHASIARVMITGNKVKGATRYGIYANSVTTAIDVKDNHISNCATGIRSDGVGARWTVSGNTVHDNSDRGFIFNTAGTNLLLVGNTLYANPGGDYYTTGTTFADFVVNNQVMTLP